MKLQTVTVSVNQPELLAVSVLTFNPPRTPVSEKNRVVEMCTFARRSCCSPLLGGSGGALVDPDEKVGDVRCHDRVVSQHPEESVL